MTLGGGLKKLHQQMEVELHIWYIIQNHSYALKVKWQTRNKHIEVYGSKVFLVAIEALYLAMSVGRSVCSNEFQGASNA